MRESFRAALVPWLVARAVVLGALALARYLSDHVHPIASAALRVHEGLLGWDAGYYRDIAGRGYGPLGHSALRFFPLLPLVTRALHFVTGLSYGTCLIGLANLAALVAGALVHRLALRETRDTHLAVAAAWVLALAPSAFVLVMGYSESLMIALAAGVFLCLRSGNWWAAGALGVLAGLTRPLGVLLALPGLIEALRPEAGRARLLPRFAAVIGPVAGCGAYLAWVGRVYGDFWAPVTVQESGNLRGHFSDPLRTAVDDLRGLAHGHLGTGLHVPWLIVFLALAAILVRRWPSSYAAYALATIGLAVASSNFDSLERYALSAFPLSLAAAGIIHPDNRFRLVLPLLGAGLVSYSLLAFFNAYVP
jgi:hypothetical protein